MVGHQHRHPQPGEQREGRPLERRAVEQPRPREVARAQPDERDWELLIQPPIPPRAVRLGATGKPLLAPWYDKKDAEHGEVIDTSLLGEWSPDSLLPGGLDFPPWSLESPTASLEIESLGLPRTSFSYRFHIRDRRY